MASLLKSLVHETIARLAIKITHCSGNNFSKILTLWRGGEENRFIGIYIHMKF